MKTFMLNDILKTFIHYIYNNFTILATGFYLLLIPFVFIYYTIGKKYNIQWILIFFASVFFYLANCSLKLAALVLIPINITYLAALLLGRTKQKKVLNIIVLLLNIIFLIYFKERNFFVSSANILSNILGAGGGDALPLLKILSPFGVSYFILMLISYYLDICWNNALPQKNPFKFISYVIFFPLMTSGPIVRYGAIEQDLYLNHSFDYESFCFGVQRIIYGMFKKMVIADRLLLVVNTIYNNYSNYSGFIILLGIFAYTFQVYFDFSGCMDIVIGIGGTLGIKIPENFRQPFFSTSLSEFWRRWHISLGLWVKDYILYPVLKTNIIQKISLFIKKKLGKKNYYAKMIPTWCGVFFVWFTVGFWHGGTWNYIFGSGLFFFIMITLGQALSPVTDKLILLFSIDTEKSSWKIFQRLRTVSLFAFSVSFGRASSLMDGISMWQRLFSEFNPWVLFDGTLFKIGLDVYDFFVLIFAMSIVFVVELLEQKNNVSVRKILADQNLVFRWIIYILMIFIIIIFGIYGPGYDSTKFIYGNF